MEDTEKLMQEAALEAKARRQFLQAAGVGLATLAVTAVNPLEQGSAYAAEAMAGLSDLDILNFALTLEHLEAVFYIQAVNSGKLRTGSVRLLLREIRDHEIAHVDTLTAVIKQLGGKPVARLPKYNFGSMGNEHVILKTAETLEGVGVGAYTGAAKLIKNKAALLPAAASIEQVESRHYAAVRHLRGLLPAPSSFGPSLTPEEVLKLAGPILGK